MKDIQSQLDHRRINIKKVGVKTITYPITVLDRAQQRQKTIATVNMYVSLPHHFKGTHMSRFIEILNQFHGRIDIKRFGLILEEMKARLEAESAHVEMRFPFFLRQLDRDGRLQVRKYQCAMHCSLEKHDDLRLDIVVPIARSFGIAPRGRSVTQTGLLGRVVVSVGFLKFLWLEDLIDIVERVIAGEELPESATAQTQSVATLLHYLEQRFSELAELRWYSITVEHESQGYALSATSCSTPDGIGLD